ncbi:LysR family transcriptional regulator [Streptomyces cinnabarinus]|uniref:LysR family transcriptional regulator n=1 Tax=Streptomyces cinnabarinus TaxID=67287 RepID=A0ABY7KJJ4_9ACTN|nr:LysR family transcriptional regulator [Streptomyces cinnabarinus]WAZ22901.1 LysR family transcriptional regulator [Streptomyces cinnabarinus]
MQIQQLRAFREVAAESSVTRAARNLNYAQSTVTAQIQNLEESVGAALFDRSHRRLTLTEAGARLLPYAQLIIDAAEAGRRAVAAEPLPVCAVGHRRPRTRRPGVREPVRSGARHGG